MPNIFLTLLWLLGMTFGLLAADAPDALGEPLSDQEVKEAVRDYLANSPDAKGSRWIAASGDGIEKKPVTHEKTHDSVYWGSWRVNPKTGEAHLVTDKADHNLKGIIRRRDGKAVIVRGEYWVNRSGRVTIYQIRSSPK